MSVSALLLGLLVGLRHAFEPDHLAAISTLVTSERGAQGVRRAAMMGAWWGIGHTASILVAVCLLTALGATLPPQLEAGFELLVSAMLVVLGLRAIVRGISPGGLPSSRTHQHGRLDHVHPTDGGHLHVAGATLAWRPLIVGLIHGMAGSGALIAAVAARTAEPGLRILYCAAFGLGSIAGMAVATAMAGVAAGRLRLGVARGLQLASGALSIGVGVWWGAASLTAL